MPQENNEAAELEHAEEIGFVIFPAADQSAEIVEPSKEALDFPAPTVATKFAAVLGALAAVSYIVGAFSRFFKIQIAGHDPTVWWRGSMGLLGFSIAVMIWRDSLKPYGTDPSKELDRNREPNHHIHENTPENDCCRERDVVNADQ